jgi:uncharacterized protein YjbI with pentapeptide repeats
MSLLPIYADRFPSWTGFGSQVPQNAAQALERGKTLWDWMDLLLVPLGLAFVAFFLNRIEKQKEESHAQENILQSYLDNMTHLLLEKGLLTSEPGAEIRIIARARTLTALHALDPRRKGTIVQFLHESHLIRSSAENQIISLKEADLNGANLRNMRLKGVNLSEAFLEYADLSNVDMRYANLTKAHLSNSNLSGAFMKWAKLQEAELTKSNLRGAYLRLTDLSRAVLRGANLQEAVLDQAVVKETNISKASLSRASFLDVDLTGLLGATEKQLNKAAKVGEKGPRVISIHQAKEDVDDEVPSGA